MKRYFVFSFITLILSNFSLGFEGSFNLFSEPKYQPKGFCDRGVHLELEYHSFGQRKATIENFVSGVCKIYVEPNNRAYNLRSIKYNNGLVVHSGSRETERGCHTVEIIDARMSDYKSLVPALIVIRETGPDYASVHYSS